MGGENYYRLLKGFLLLKEELLRLQEGIFFKEGDSVHVYKDQLDMLADLRGIVASYSNESLTFSCNFQESSLGLFSDFDHFIDDARNINETYMYCATSCSKLKTVVVLTVMEIGHCICYSFFISMLFL